MDISTTGLNHASHTEASGFFLSLLGKAARNVLTKISAVLPDDLKECIERSGLLIGPGEPIPAGDSELPLIREAIRTERKIRIVYADEQGSSTRRIIWPAALAFYDRVRVVVAWGELRDGYRHFRTDRIVVLEPTTERYSRRRASLLKEWRTLRGIPEQ